MFTLNFYYCCTSAIASQALWYNKNIKIDNKSIYLAEFSKKGLNCIGYLFNERQKLGRQNMGTTKTGI